jgi:hypothetical protein
MIKVTQTEVGDPMVFNVVVEGRNGHSEHRVSMAESTYQRLTGGSYTPLECVDASFRFLIEREPVESILKSFDVKVISMLFSNFEEQVSEYFPKK